MMFEESYRYIIERIVKNAYDALDDVNKNPGEEFYIGHRLAYYEVLDIIKTELDVRDEDLEKYGLDIDLEKTFL